MEWDYQVIAGGQNIKNIATFDYIIMVSPEAVGGEGDCEPNFRRLKHVYC
jgi:hypothetical protein